MKPTNGHGPCLLFAFCCLLGGPQLHAAAVVSFTGSNWTSGANGATPTSQLGYVEATPGTGSTGSSGFTSVTDSSNGESVTVTFTGTFVGTSERAPSGFTGNLGSFQNSTGNPMGFILGSIDDNSSTLTVGDGTQSITGMIENYQRWDFLFSKPVILNEFRLLDIDSDGGNDFPPDFPFRDIVAAERFLGTSVGLAGTGIDATVTPVDPVNSTIYQSDGATIGGQSINSVISPINLANPSSTDPVNVNVSFGNVALQAFSIYTYSDSPTNHRISLDGSGFEITVVPEPSSALLMALGSFFMLRRRR